MEPTAASVKRPERIAFRLLRSRGLQTLVGVGLIGWLLVEAIAAMGGPEAIRETYGMRLAWAAVPVQAVVAVSPVPGEIVALASSAVHGFWLGCLLNWLGWMLAAYLEYALFRRTVRDVVLSPEDLPRWLRRFPADHPAFLIAGRFLPFGSHLVNGLSGARQLSLVRFTWTSAVALVPGAVLISAIANGMVSLS